MSGKDMILSTSANHVVKYAYDDAGGLDVIQTVYDVEPALMSAEMARDRTPGKDMRHIAEIPQDVLDRAMKEGWVHDAKAWRKWLNDPDNMKYRVHKG